MPTPMKCAQTRLAMLVAKNGLSGLVIHEARTSRRSFTFDFRRVAAEKLRCQRFSKHRMIHFAAGAIEDNDFSIVFAGLATDLRKEGCKAIVIVHRPTIERMIMALGALSADAHEYLGHIFSSLERVAFDLVEICGRLFEDATTAGDQFANDLIDRHVVSELVG